jgi:KDO2-lipid IV(A) lauroyltransferase
MIGRGLRRRIRSLARVTLIRILVPIFGALPWSLAQRLGAGIGSIFYLLKSEHRRLSIEHLGIAFPELAPGKRCALARASFRHLGASAGELLHIRSRPPSAASHHVQVEGFEEVERQRQLGRPILILTAHIGNWELISTANYSHGLGLAAIARQLDDRGLHRFSVELRAHLGSETIARGSSTASRQLLRVLRSGGALAMLIDQDIDTEGVFVPFFGRLAHTTVAAAQIARRLQAAVVPTFAERCADGSHLVRFHPALDLPEDPIRAIGLMTAVIEKQIRKRPEQWVWLHQRWKRRPARPQGEA